MEIDSIAVAELRELASPSHNCGLVSAMVQLVSMPRVVFVQVKVVPNAAMEGIGFEQQPFYNLAVLARNSTMAVVPHIEASSAELVDILGHLLDSNCSQLVDHRGLSRLESDLQESWYRLDYTNLVASNYSLEQIAVVVGRQTLRPHK